MSAADDPLDGRTARSSAAAGRPLPILVLGVAMAGGTAMASLVLLIRALTAGRY